MDAESLILETSRSLLTGWNTWDATSTMTHVLLPDGLALIVGLRDDASGALLDRAFVGNRVGSERLALRACTPDGTYRCFDLRWETFGLRVESVAMGDDLSLLITPDPSSGNRGAVTLRADFFYADKPGHAEITPLPGIEAQCGARRITVRVLGDWSVASESSIECRIGGAPIAITTHRSAGVDEVSALVRERREAYDRQVSTYGGDRDVFNVIQNSVNWVVKYDPADDRVVTPVAQTWSYGWGKGEPGGYVLFCWDNLFCAYMHSLVSKALAYNEAFQMLREIDELGFVPNFAGPRGAKSRDRSQPPVGSLMVKELYKRFQEKWFLEAVFERLLCWNRWWKDNRDSGGYLCWGSNAVTPRTSNKHESTNHDHGSASNESGLDNTPMYDDVPFNEQTSLLEIGDVGLMGLYVADCNALAEIALELGRTAEAAELEARAARYREKLRTMWSEEHGLFLNRRTDTGAFSTRISPTHFYPLIGRAATEEQAQRMVNEHLLNPKELWGEYVLPSISRSDPAYTGREYWRGSIWAPMNFLVYLGLRNYDIHEARKALVDKSRTLLMNEWNRSGYVRENYDAETGSDSVRSEHHYHWGALLGMMSLIEHGHVAPPEAPLLLSMRSAATEP
jgi:hypothetical protein